MRKIVAGQFITLDGVVEIPEEWMGPYFTPELGQAIGSMMAAQDAMLLGRITYEMFAAHWPRQARTTCPPFAAIGAGLTANCEAG